MSQAQRNSHSSLTGTNLRQVLQQLETQIPPSDNLEELEAWMQSPDRWSGVGGSTRLLMAAVEPESWILRDANDTFCRLANLTPNGNFREGDISLLDLFPDWDPAEAQTLYRRCVLHLVLRDLYQWEVTELPLSEESILLTFPHSPNPRIVEFWPNFSPLQILRQDPQIDEFAEFNLAQLRTQIDWSLLEQRLQLDNYQLQGNLLLEGFDVTNRESTLRLTQLLIDRESVLNTEKFQYVNERVRSLFRARDTVILCVEHDRVQVFVGLGDGEFSSTRYSMQSLEGSHFLQAARAARVWLVPDLASDCQTKCEQSLLDLGIRSLLLIPIVVQPRDTQHNKAQLAGLVGVMSEFPHHFNRLDCKHATELIPAFTCALRQAIQQRVTTIRNIHPSVEWRFLQEAERRSWGLPPEKIVFENVYPLYGISDIRGSSKERNRAIQTDLLEQFQLGLAVVDAVCQAEDSPLTEQLRLDLLDYIESLQSRVTVDAEVTATDYLKQHLEIYFDYFAQCSPEAQGAVAAYRKACDNEHDCIYTARATYDRTLGEINTLLRDTWDRWQGRMQQMIPHYCDLEMTDGIDHMLYAGPSIEPRFRAYHLRSLRYEQLRAVCDCARTAFGIQAQYETSMEVTHLVLVQDTPIDIFHDENTEKLFDVKGTKDIRYEIVKKRIDKAVDRETRTRITQPGMLTIVYSTDEEWNQYQQYLRYLAREGWVSSDIESGLVEPLQGVTGLKFARVRVLEASDAG